MLSIKQIRKLMEKSSEELYEAMQSGEVSRMGAVALTVAVLDVILLRHRLIHLLKRLENPNLTTKERDTIWEEILKIERVVSGSVKTEVGGE